MRLRALAVLEVCAALLGSAALAGATTPTPTATGGFCAGVSAWVDCCGCTYTQGQKVTYGSPASRYHALQTFTNACGAGWNPSAAASLWANDGSCGSSTATATSTSTATATRTPTATSTSSATATRTPTATATKTPTPTATKTPTATSRSTRATATSTTVFCPTETPPPTPAATDLAAKAGDKQVALTWTQRANRYDVYRATAMNGPYTKIATGVASSYNDATGLVNGTTYYYTVQGFVDWSYGVPPCPVHSGTLATPFSNMVTAVPQALTPTPVPSPSLTVSVSRTSVMLGSAVTVTGTTNLGIGQFTVTVIDLATGVEQDQANPIVTPARAPAQASPSFTFTAARVGAVRFNMVVSGEWTDPSCSSCFSMRSAGGASVPVSSGAPVATGSWGRLACDGTLQAGAALSWVGVPGATGYNLRFAKSPAGPFSLYGTVPGGSFVTVSDPTKSGYYQVTALSGSAEGPPSNLAQVLFFSTCP